MGSLEIMKMDIKRILRSPKFYLLMLFTLYFLLDFTKNIKLYAQAIDLGVTPYVYPMFYGDGRSRMFALFVIILLMSDAPYVDSSQKYTYIRTGNGRWMFGKILYIAGVSVLYQFIFILLSIVALAPELGLSTDWGDVLRVLANNPLEVTNMFGDRSLGYIVQHYTPLEAMLYTLILSSAVSIIIGLFIFLINGLTHSMLGTILALIVSTAEMLLEMVVAKGFHIKYPTIMAWMSLGDVSVGETISGKTPIGSLLLVFAGVGIVMSIFIYVIIRKKIINIAEK